MSNARSSEAERRAVTYAMLFRVVVVTMLLVALGLGEWLGRDDAGVVSPIVTTLTRYIALTYALTIVFALALRRTQNVARIAGAQAVADLTLTTALVYLTGGADSSFVFLQLLAIVGAAAVLREWAPFIALGALGGYATASVLVFFGVVPSFAAVPAVSASTLVRTLAINAIAFVATGLLSRRLAGEIKVAQETADTTRERLRDFETVHRSIVDSLTSGLVTIDAGGRILTVNPTAAVILGTDERPLVGLPLADAFPALAELVDSVGHEAELRRGEVIVAGRALGVTISPLRDATGGRVINFQDLTELRRMEELVARQTQLAAIGRLAAGIAHEIRNPLQAISGSIEIIADLPELRSDEASHELTQIVLRESERLNRLISDLLEFARPRELQLVDQDLHGSVTEMLRVFTNDPKLGAVPITVADSPPMWVAADSALMRQVVWNLVRNAAQASPSGVEILFREELEPSGRRLVALTIRDHGPGIPTALRSRIFEPFFSTKEGGTGLGLAIVHRIVEQHGGTIVVETPSDGAGTAMVVRLPGGKPAPPG